MVTCKRILARRGRGRVWVTWLTFCRLNCDKFLINAIFGYSVDRINFGLTRRVLLIESTRPSGYAIGITAVQSEGKQPAAGCVVTVMSKISTGKYHQTLAFLTLNCLPKTVRNILKRSKNNFFL